MRQPPTEYDTAEYDTDIVVVGAGPVGLLLACELRTAGVGVVLLERRRRPDPQAKAGVLGPLAVEALERRGLRPALDRAERIRLRLSAGRGPTDHFAGLELRPTAFAPPPARRRLAVDQRELERILADHARRFGVGLRRGHRLTGLEQDPAGATAYLEGPAGPGRLRCRYLVGCDGGHSTVRSLAGIGFPGAGPTLSGHQAVVHLGARERLSLGWSRSPGGMIAFGLGADRVFTVEFDRPPADRRAPVTVEELRASLDHAAGRTVDITEVRSAGRFTDNARQAAAYRRDRVFLAGDAAHVHPPFGGQGLNAGLMDAANLGWKLAAAVHGWAPDGLLDSYQSERRPAGAGLLRHALAQVALMRPDPQTEALREIFDELMDLPEVHRYLWQALCGLDCRYELGGDDPLSGTACPDLALAEVSGQTERATRLAALMRDGRGLLLDLADDPGLRAAAAPWAPRVRAVGGRLVDGPAPWAEAQALLVRPDGCVAWARSRPAAGGSPVPALETWFGTAAAPADRTAA